MDILEKLRDLVTTNPIEAIGVANAVQHDRPEALQYVPDQTFDTIWMDIWPTISVDDLDEAEEMLDHYQPFLKPGGWMAAWSVIALEDNVERMGLEVRAQWQRLRDLHAYDLRPLDTKPLWLRTQEEVDEALATFEAEPEDIHDPWAGGV